MRITIKRDIVCAGDDASDRCQSFELPEYATAKELFRQLKKSRFFPRVAGNNAVWVLTNKTRPFCIFSYFTKRRKLCQNLMDVPAPVTTSSEAIIQFAQSLIAYAVSILAIRHASNSTASSLMPLSSSACFIS